jgi:polysaccharide chain length determinant protein (PEP-CTERM system associated)
MLSIAWAICVVGWTFVARMPDQYSASARVYVDTQSVLQPLLQGIALDMSNSSQTLALMTRTLLSRPNLEKLMRMTDLDLQATTEVEKEAIVDEIKKKVGFQSSRDNIYVLTYTDESPDLARLMVKSLLTLFMESNLGEVRKDQDSATQFLEQQKAEYERRMRELENELFRFKQRNLALLPEGSGGYSERVRDGKQGIAALQLEIAVLNERLETTKAQLSGESENDEFGIGWSPEFAQVADTREIDQRIQNAKIRLDDLYLKYTERHPDVIFLQRQLESLQAERAGIIAQARQEAEQPANVEQARSQNPVYQQMRLSVAQLEADMAAKKRLLAEREAQLAELEGSIDKVLALEAEKRDLQSDYEIAVRNHEVLESRLESVRVGRRADSSTDSVRFRIIEPPRVPSQPSGPHRVLFSSLVLFVALGAGIGVAFLLSQLRPTFDDRQMLGESLGLPVLGSVNMVWTSDQVRARKIRNVSFVLTLSGLLLSFGVVLALYQFDIEVLPRLAQSLNLV